jgi:hypothetical protein
MAGVAKDMATMDGVAKAMATAVVDGVAKAMATAVVDGVAKATATAVTVMDTKDAGNLSISLRPRALEQAGGKGCRPLSSFTAATIDR